MKVFIIKLQEKGMGISSFVWVKIVLSYKQEGGIRCMSYCCKCWDSSLMRCCWLPHCYLVDCHCSIVDATYICYFEGTLLMLLWDIVDATLILLMPLVDWGILHVEETLLMPHVHASLLILHGTCWWLMIDEWVNHIAILLILHTLWFMIDEECMMFVWC